MNPNARIILNTLPPAETETPSTALSILKSFLNRHNVDAEIKYWNLLMTPALSGYPFSDYAKQVFRDGETLQFLFYAILADEFNDPEAEKRILALFQGHMPFFKFYNPNFYRDFIRENKRIILQIIETELAKIDPGNVMLYGITSKFFQWIPGMLLAREFKKKYPHIKVVIGGLSNKEQALAVMNMCPAFDLAHWGEGEYALLELCRQARENDFDYEKIPRLVYRPDTGEKEKLKISDAGAGEYLDLNENLYADYTDYFETAKGKLSKDDVVLYFDTIRGCAWNQCNFCVLSAGYQYREKTPENIIKEIEYYADTHQVYQFFITDNNMIGKSVERFEHFLNLVIESAAKRGKKYSIGGSIIHKDLNERVMRKLAEAGFGVQFGYEALADSLLQKMNKSSSFCDNLLLAKFVIKYDVRIWSTNLIRGIPHETEEDVLESIDNLHFLRFFLDQGKFYHEFQELAVYGGSKYHAMLSDQDKTRYIDNFYAHFLPQAFITSDCRFNLFYYVKPLEFHYLWQQAEAIEKYYRENKTHYSLTINDAALCYEEFHNDQCVKSLRFEAPLYVDLLTIINDKVCSFQEIGDAMSLNHPHITVEKIKEILSELKTHYLVYHDKTCSKAVSVVDISRIFPANHFDN